MKPIRHIVWSTDKIDMNDPFQKKWFIRQVLIHGRAEDIRKLDLNEVEKLLDELNLPEDIYRLWKTYFEVKSHASG